MGRTVNLEQVSAAVLPAKVLVLLSKYAQAMRTHTGLVIKISSMNVFKHVHNTQKLTQHPAVKKLHLELLLEVSSHLERGTMHTTYDRDRIQREKSSSSTTAGTNLESFEPYSEACHDITSKAVINEPSIVPNISA